MDRKSAQSSPFFSDDEETREVIRFISEEEAGVMDVIPERIKAPAPLPAPQGYVPRDDVKTWTPRRKRKARAARTPFPILRIAFISISIACLLGFGVALYSIAHIVQSGI